MDKSKPSHEQMLDAVKDSGFLFEHSTATVFENAGFHVETAWPFEDPESKKSREIDVRAIKGLHNSPSDDVQVFLELLIECKASKSPFVFLERHKNKRELNNLRFEQYVFKKKQYEKLTAPNTHTILWPSEYFGLDEHYYLAEEKKANNFTKVVRKGSAWVANHDGIYDSLILPIAKAAAHRIKSHRKGMEHIKKELVFLIFPCVVLEGDLVAIDTSDDNNISERKRVSFVRNFDSGAVQGELLIDFVSADGIGQYIEDIEVFGRHVRERITALRGLA